MKSITIAIGGMHCAACMQAVKQVGLSFKDVSKVVVNLKTSTMTMDFEEASTPNPQDLEATLKPKIEELGYQWNSKMGEPNQDSSWETIKSWILPVVLAGAGIYGFISLDASGLMGSLINKPGSDTQSLGYLALAGSSLLMGVIASLSSCLAVVGSLVISFSAQYGGTSMVRPNILFHLGRIGTFVLLGAVLGLIGLNIEGLFSGATARYVGAIFQILVGILLILSAAMILGNKTVGNALGKLVPPGVSKLLNSLSSSDSPVAPMVLGALTFILPCGFTQSMQAEALASGSLLHGATILGFFALGTMPVLLGIGLGVSWTKNRGGKVFTRFAGLLVVFMSLWTMGAGFAMLRGAGIQESMATPGSTPGSTSSQVSALPQEGVFTVDMHVTYGGFEPQIIEIPAGKEIQWTVHGDEVTGCTNAIIVPDLGLRFKVNRGANVITFTAPSSPGMIDYSCWMGMVQGKIRVLAP